MKYTYNKCNPGKQDLSPTSWSCHSSENKEDFDVSFRETHSAPGGTIANNN